MGAKLQFVLGRLPNARRTGKGWIALCPAHCDRSPSLSLREDNRKVLLHCYAGCATEAICAALGIKMSDLFAEDRRSTSMKPKRVHDAEQQIANLRSRLTPRDRQRSVTVVLTDEANLDAGIARALALAVEGELVQVAWKEMP